MRPLNALNEEGAKSPNRRHSPEDMPVSMLRGSVLEVEESRYEGSTDAEALRNLCIPFTAAGHVMSRPSRGSRRPPLRVMAKAAGAVDLVCRLLVTVVNLRNSKQEVDAPIEELY